MGGLLIANILNEGINKQILSKSTRLVLQPNNAEKDLRLFLQINQYEIIKEAIVEEHNKIYEVIVAEYKSEKIKYSEDELTFGPLLLRKNIYFYKKWQAELNIHENILEQLRNTKNIKKIEAIQKNSSNKEGANMTTVKDIIKRIEEFAPTYLAEDGIGWTSLGSYDQEVNKMMVALDLDTTTLKEAKEKNIDFIFTHHPPIFGSLNTLNEHDARRKEYIELKNQHFRLCSTHKY